MGDFFNAFHARRKASKLAKEETMKITILVPDTKSQTVSSPLYKFGSRLLKDLKDTPYDLSLYSIAIENLNHMTVSSTTLKDLYEFFSRAEGIDVVHNLIGLPPLYLVPNPVIPILTTLFKPPNEEMTSLMHSPPPQFFFSSIDTVTGIEGTNYLGTITPSKIPDQIPPLYEKINALARREDHRPWGYYVVLADEADHKVKRIVVWPRKRLSPQRHHRRSEHWHLIRGKAIVTLDDKQILLEAGESVDIPKGAAHRIQNPEPEEHLAFIEVQRGDYFGEDDIERLEDDYGRT